MPDIANINHSVNRAPPAGAVDLLRAVIALLDQVPHWLIALLARIGVAQVFWASGRTKVEGFALKDSTFFLFESEYQVPLLPPELAAYAATVAEHVFPVLLLMGFASRLSALALLGMTAVIQIFVYPGAWTVHILWAVILLYIAARGPGAVSLDHLLARRFGA